LAVPRVPSTMSTGQRPESPRFLIPAFLWLIVTILVVAREDGLEDVHAWEHIRERIAALRVVLSEANILQVACRPMTQTRGRRRIGVGRPSGDLQIRFGKRILRFPRVVSLALALRLVPRHPRHQCIRRDIRVRVLHAKALA
jgi:hypothetical protein